MSTAAEYSRRPATVTPELLERARSYNRGAVAEVLAACYPSVHRLAHALAGREDVGRGIVRFVLSRSMRVLPTWEDEGDPMRWFQHHTVLTARRAVRHQPDPQQDLLVTNSEQTSPAYVAFMRGVRGLPIQQKEAFMLHHGERLNARYLAVAMDCSTEAAGQHLEMANRALRMVSGEQFDTFTRLLNRAYNRLEPSEEIVLPLVRRQVRRYVWPRRVARSAGWILILSILGALAWAAWMFVPLIDV